MRRSERASTGKRHTSAVHPRWVSAVAALLSAALIVVGLPTAAVAAPDDATMTLTKTVVQPKPAYVPGDQVVFDIKISCSALDVAGCISATVTDTLPPPLQLDTSQGNPIASVIGVGNQYTATSSGTSISVVFTQPLDGTDTGLSLGTADVTIRVLARVPTDITAAQAGQITNIARATSTNALPVEAAAPITLAVPLRLSASAAKTVSPGVPAGQPIPAVPGRAVGYTIGGSNTSNTTVDTLTVQDPADAGAGPFAYLALTGITTLTPPGGADRVEVFWRDAAGTWTSATGGPVVLPADPNTLLNGLDLPAVNGLRFVFAASAGAIAIQPAGSGASIQLGTVTRASVLDIPDGTTVTVANTAQVQVAAGTEVSAATTASASVQIRRVKPTVTIAKQFDRPTVLPGELRRATLTAQIGDAPVSRLVIAEPGAAGADLTEQGLTFAGFVGVDIEWPVGATRANIAYRYTDGDSPTQTTTTRDTLPAPAPGRVVIGFTVEFTGAMERLEFAGIPFRVQAQPVPGTVDVTSVNSTTAQVFDPLGQQSDVIRAEAPLTRQPLRVTTTLQKNIVRDFVYSVPGTTTLVQLQAAVAQGAGQSTVGAQSLVVSDPADPSPGAPPSPFWDAFDLQQIVATEVPAGSKLTISSWNGTAWVALPGASNIAGPSNTFTFTPTPAQRAQIQGLRYTFTPLTAGALLQPGFNVLPYYRVAVRDALRSDSGTPVTGTAATVVNDASSVVANANATPATATATGTDSIELRPTTGGPGGLVSKGWLVNGVPSDDLATVTAQTEQQQGLRISWGTNSFPFSRMTITDPATSPALSDVAASVYDAFDLARIQPITAATDPLMTFDAVDRVELFSANTGGWVDITPVVCGAANVRCDGAFPGYTLTAAERASTLAVRVSVIESPSRAQRAVKPTDPAVGSGVAGSGIVRPLDLLFQLRQDLRSDPSQAVLGTTSDYTYNTGSAGVVDNTAEVTGSGAAGTFSGRDGSPITILDSPLNVALTKTFDQDALGIPPAGTAAGLYPLLTATLTATNLSVSKVRALAVIDPSPGQAAPTSYDTLNLSAIAAITVPAGTTTTTVTLARSGIDTDYSVAAALALTPGQLSDVTGVTVRHAGAVASQASTTITLVYQLRALTRSTADPIAPGRISENVARAVLGSPGGTAANLTVADARDDVLFVLPTYSVTAQKSFSATSRFEDQSPNYTMTLRSRPGGTARTTTLAVEDATPTFWNSFTFTGLTQTTLPVPVRQMKVDALVGVEYAVVDGELVALCAGSTTLDACWVSGLYRTAPANGRITGVLPAGVTPAQVRGLRYSFRTATGGNWERPYNPQVTTSFTVTRNQFLRYGVEGATDQRVPSTQPGLQTAPGEAVQGTTTDTADADGLASWRNGENLWQADASATATTRLLHRPTRIEILKTPTGPRSPQGETLFQISVRNTGDRAITDLTLVDDSSIDESGALLREPDRDDDDEDPIYSFTLTDAAGTAKSTDGFGAALDTRTGRIDIDIPSGFVFAVGDTLVIRASLQFRIGLLAETPVVNTVVATSERLFDSCVPGINGVAQPRQTNVDSCEATTVVTPIPGAPLRIIKGVKGNGAGVAGATPGDDNYDDLGILALNVPNSQCLRPNSSSGFWRSPCIPITRPGGSETWQLQVTNLGNIPANVVSVIDVLPAFGDRGVIIDQPRRSAWPVVFEGGVQATGTAGPGETRQVLYLTTTPAVACNAADLRNDTGVLAPTDPCAADVNARNWQPLTADLTSEQLAAVKAIKLLVTYDDPTVNGLPPGRSLGITYETRTAWQADVAERADRDSIAWNSVAGAARGARNRIDFSTTPIEPRKVGVAMATGKIDLAKDVVVPPGWNLTLPNSYPVDMTCLSGPEQVTLVDTAGASRSRVTLPADGSDVLINDGSDPVTSAWSNVNLPLYASCSIAEASPTPGVDVSYSTQPVTALRDFATRPNVVDPAFGDPIALGRIDVTNTYRYAGFTVTKAVDDGPAVDADGTSITFDETYTFSASCVFLGQQAVAAADRSFTLRRGETKTFADVPAGSSCTIRETDRGAAASSSFQVTTSGVAGPTVPGASSTFTLVAGPEAGAAPQTAVTATNVYTAGSAAITKALAGPGAAAWGGAQFDVRMVCTLDAAEPDTVFDASRTLTRDAPTWQVTGLAAGARCTVTETRNGGANSTAISPTSFTVTDAASPARVTVTNTFTTGTIAVRKVLSGAPAANLAPATTDSYTVSLACTRLVNGAVIDAPVPGGAERTIAGAGSATYSGLPTGATCQVTELDAGFASSSTVAPMSVLVGAATTVQVTVTNTFANGSLNLTKIVSGAGAALAPATFPAVVDCTWQGAAVPLPGGGAVTLRPGRTTTLTGIPVDSICAVTEDDSGQDDTVYTPQTVVIAASDQPTATIQTDNVYLLASLRVAKDVDPNEGAVPNGFRFSAECTYRGRTVLSEPDFALDGGEVRNFIGLPSRSSCTVTETDARGAVATVTAVQVDEATAAPTVDQDARTVVIPELTRDQQEGVARNTVTFVNLYDVSALVVQKSFGGSAADVVGIGRTFPVAVECVSEGETVLDAIAQLSPEDGYSVAYFPVVVGARCTVIETDDGNADAVVITPNDGDPLEGVVIIPPPGLVSVDVKNWFLGGSLAVTKVLTGAGAEKFGTGTFEVTLTCTLGGEPLEIDDGGIRRISAADPVTTYTGLPTGSGCRVAETATGGASDHYLADFDGERLDVDDEGGYTFTVITDAENLTDEDQPQAPVTAVNDFLLASVAASKETTTVSGDAVTGVTGPFTITAVCLLEGVPVNAAEPADRAIEAGETVVWTELPVGAQCDVTETDARGAVSTRVAVGDFASVEGTSVAVELVAGSDGDPETVRFTNIYPDPLPVTGGTVAWAAAGGGLALVLLGLVLVLARRRRRSRP